MSDNDSPTVSLSFRFDDLRGRTILVTGAANGIGRALAEGMAGQGCRLILIDKDERALEDAATGIAGSVTGAVAATLVCDLADSVERARLARQIAETVPAVDGLIHNAGIDPRMRLQDTSLERFRHVMATNVEPALELTRDLLPFLQRSAAGRVVLIGSITFEIGTGLLAAYVASKGALVGLTRSLAHELGPCGITVNCIAPGAIFVEREEQRLRSTENASTEAQILSWQSVRRRLVPADLLGLACLLLSEAGGAMTGQVFQVDGGLVHPMADPAFQASIHE